MELQRHALEHHLPIIATSKLIDADERRRRPTGKV
jgi:hypothetical protein